MPGVSRQRWWWVGLLCPVVLVAAGAVTRLDPVVASVAVESDAPESADVGLALRAFLRDLPADEYLVAPTTLEPAEVAVVDLRPAAAYVAGHIAGARSVPLRDLVTNLEALPAPDQTIVLADDTGFGSAIGMAILRMLGYERAGSLHGGMRAWQGAGRAVVSGPFPPPHTRVVPAADAGLRAALDYYLSYTLPADGGAMSAAALSEDQRRLSSAEVEAQPETFDQGRSLLVDVDAPDRFERAGLDRDLNVPLGGLPDGLADMPLTESVNWA